jgi:acyl dehydratase
MSERYLKDYAAGQTFGSGRVRVDKESIIAFAAEFDPQPFHLDEALAADTFFRALAASGWHTAAMTMRLLVHGELKPAGGIVGTGFDEFRCPRPARWRRTACRERNTGGPAVKIPSEPGDHQGVHDDVQSE